MPPRAHPTAEDRQWRQQRRSGSRTGGPLHGLRICDLEVLFQDRYGARLSDDDAGRDDAILMLHHLAHHAYDPRSRMRQWLALRCPWMGEIEAQQMLERVITNPRKFKADRLAAKFNLTAADRTRLKITTIGAVDLLREQRLQRRRHVTVIANDATGGPQESR
jgi:hypothetical protein